jgi:uncharacterized membrane protein
MMSNLTVLTFEDMVQAGEAREALQKIASGGYLKIDDSAVIVKNEDGKVEVKNQTDTGVKWGAFGGGMLGLLLAGVFFPLAGLAIGAVAGALVGKSLNMGVDKQFVKDVTETLKPGSSALFVLTSQGEPGMVMAAMRPFKATIYQTTLPTEAVEELQAALKKKEE